VQQIEWVNPEVGVHTFYNTNVQVTELSQSINHGTRIGQFKDTFPQHKITDFFHACVK